jgi:hypothetical protein
VVEAEPLAGAEALVFVPAVVSPSLFQVKTSAPRSRSTTKAPAWRARRSARFLARLCMGAWRQMLAARPLGRQGIAADTR